MTDKLMEAETIQSGRKTVRLVPRMKKQGYLQEDIAFRRAWVEQESGQSLPMIGACAIPGEDMRGNIENPIGSIQMPLGVSGPLLLHGQHAQGVFYIPMATTEGALVRSYERGMVTISRAGGATVRFFGGGNQISPNFFFESLAEAADFTTALPDVFEGLKEAAESTTHHGKLLRVVPNPLGRQVMVTFHYDTADAQGMNMIAKATEAACLWLVQEGLAHKFQVFSGLSGEKRAGGHLFSGGKGRMAIAGVRIPAKIATSYLRTSPAAFRDLWQNTVLGHIRGNLIGYNGHLANGLTALFIATGQDVANVTNASVGITNFEVTQEGDLYASVTLPSLTLATIGGGVSLGTSRECLQMMDCHGAGKAAKLAEIVAGTVLAGELSFGAAIASGEFVAAHETYGRNRPQEGPTP